MPRLSSWLIRASLLHLGAGFLIGALLLSRRALPALDLPAGLHPAHQELLSLGWTLQLFLGVAYWILPRRRGGAPRGPSAWAWTGLALLNGGVLVTAGAALLGHGPGALAGRLASLCAAIILAVLLWPRVRPAAASPPVDPRHGGNGT